MTSPLLIDRRRFLWQWSAADVAVVAAAASDACAAVYLVGWAFAGSEQCSQKTAEHTIIHETTNNQKKPTG